MMHRVAATLAAEATGECARLELSRDDLLARARATSAHGARGGVDVCAIEIQAGYANAAAGCCEVVGRLHEPSYELLLQIAVDSGVESKVYASTKPMLDKLK